MISKLRGDRAAYDTIGRTYAGTRTPDRRIEHLIWRNFGDSQSVLNVGAGTGSYEPLDRTVVAIEPSMTMIAQRRVTSAPVVCGIGEALPFPEDSFDVAMAVLTVHHWTDQIKGLRELRRVASKRVVILTYDAEEADTFWLVRDYLPSNARIDRTSLPKLDVYHSVFPNCTVQPVPIPHDCQDGFLCAFWKRPDAYLSPTVQAGISSFSVIPEKEVEHGLAALEADLKSGRWAARNQELASLRDKDFGYRLIVAETG